MTRITRSMLRCSAIVKMNSRSSVTEIAMIESTPNNAKSVGDVHLSNGHDLVEDKQFSLQFWLRLEVIGLLVLIVIVWGLLTLPIIFFHIPVTVS